MDFAVKTWLSFKESHWDFKKEHTFVSSLFVGRNHFLILVNFKFQLKDHASDQLRKTIYLNVNVLHHLHQCFK